MNPLPALPPDHAARMFRALVALDGLSVGDALGSQFFLPDYFQHLDRTDPLPDPPGPWPYTDDTEMAIAVVDELAGRSGIDPAALAARFARRFDRESFRGYGPGMIRLLSQVHAGADYAEANKKLFSGMGSFGNGAAMRIAPLGAYFAGDYANVVEQATLATLATHAHAEGVAGGVATAVAAAYAWENRADVRDPAVRRGLFDAVLAYTPESDVRFGIAHAAAIDLALSPDPAARLLGNGSRVTCQDTVPFCVWVAARHLDDYPRALHETFRVGGDIDTNGAIVGGIVGLAAPVPKAWLREREDLVFGV